jgi:hypothetical protein
MIETGACQTTQDPRNADALIAAYAHELAQQIRETSRTNYGQVSAAYGHDYARGWASGRQRGADLIDPEVAKP